MRFSSVIQKTRLTWIKDDAFFFNRRILLEIFPQVNIALRFVGCSLAEYAREDDVKSIKLLQHEHSQTYFGIVMRSVAI